MSRLLEICFSMTHRYLHRYSYNYDSAEQLILKGICLDVFQTKSTELIFYDFSVLCIAQTGLVCFSFLVKLVLFLIQFDSLLIKTRLLLEQLICILFKPVEFFVTPFVLIVFVQLLKLILDILIRLLQDLVFLLMVDLVLGYLLLFEYFLAFLLGPFRLHFVLPISLHFVVLIHAFIPTNYFLIQLIA